MMNAEALAKHQIQTVQRPDGRWSFVVVSEGKTITAGGSYSTEQEAVSHGSKRSSEIAASASKPQ